MSNYSRKPLVLLLLLGALAAPLTLFAWNFNSKSPAREFRPADKGWWEVQEGVYARWCSTQHPCPQTKGILSNTWRLHVWCKSSDCGNIIAFANVYNGKIIVANDSASAIADRGDQVILTFSSETGGTAVRLVRFSAQGGTKNQFPLILRTNDGN